MEDTVSEPIKILSTCIVVVVSVFDAIAVNAISNAKRTPSNCRFMSLGLIFMDWAFMVIACVRVWSTKYVVLRIYSERMCYTMGTLVFNTVSLMSYDRYLLFTSTQFYAEHLQNANGKKIICMFWFAQLVLVVGFRLVYCVLVHGEHRFNGVCVNRIGQVFGACTVMAISTATYFCVRIFLLIREKRRYMKQFLTVTSHMTQAQAKKQAKPRKMRNDERSSYLVFSYMFSIVVGMMGFITYLYRSEYGIGHDYFRATMVLTIVQCIADPLLYVFWFRECRMQLLEMFVCLVPALRTKVNNMRIEIFDIVTASSNARTSYSFNQT